jgi:hypothetical protein
MTDALYQLIYLSRNDLAGDEKAQKREIESILETSRQNNPKVGVTGALMFNTGCFAQVLEGSHGAIQATFERIQCDTRHSRVTVLAFKPAEKRGFSHWAMAYVGQNARNIDQFARFGQDSNFDASLLNGDDIYQVLKAQLIEAESA